MSSRSGTVPFARLRAAAAARVEEVGLRPASREIGMSAPGLRSLVEGTEPHPSTQRKLERWYLAAAAERGAAMDSELVRLFLSLLLSDLPPDRRGPASEEAVRLFERIYASERAPTPQWLRGLLQVDAPNAAEGTG